MVLLPLESGHRPADFVQTVSVLVFLLPLHRSGGSVRCGVCGDVRHSDGVPLLSQAVVGLGQQLRVVGGNVGPPRRGNDIADFPGFHLRHIQSGQGLGEHRRGQRGLSYVNLLVGGGNGGIRKARFRHMNLNGPIHIAHGVVGALGQGPGSGGECHVFNSRQGVRKYAGLVSCRPGQGDRGLGVIRGQLGGVGHVHADNGANGRVPSQKVGGDGFAKCKAGPVRGVAQAGFHIPVALNEQGRVDVGRVVKVSLALGVHLLDGRCADIGRHRPPGRDRAVGKGDLLPIYAMLVFSRVSHVKSPPFRWNSPPAWGIRSQGCPGTAAGSRTNRASSARCRTFPFPKACGGSPGPRPTG